MHQQQEQAAALKFIQQLTQCHIAVTTTLKTAQDQAKQRHDKQRTYLSFQPGDQVWLHLDKKRFKSQHHKLMPIRYGPYTILDKIGENAYRLDLPPQLGIHDVINVNQLKLFEPPLLEEPVTITHPVDNIPDFQMPLDKDTILDTKTRFTRNREHISYLVARQGQAAAQATWMIAEALQHRFP